VTEYTHPILIKGNYQVVAMTQDEQYDPGEVTSYAVQTMTGARLRKDLSLEDARIWIDRLIEEENLQRAEAPVRAKPMRQRR
jgi:hypothetical protein